MDLTKLMEELRGDEDDVPYAYQDSLGFWTIGVGHLIDKRKGGRLSQAARDFILTEDIQDVEAELDSTLSWWRTLSEARQRVLANMCFNLGLPGLLGFKNFLAALQRGDFDTAVTEMLDSKWATQVGDRSTRLAKMIKEG